MATVRVFALPKVRGSPVTFRRHTDDGHAMSPGITAPDDLRQTVEPVVRRHMASLIDDIVKIAQFPPEKISSAVYESIPPAAGIEYVYGLAAINKKIAVAVDSSRAEILTAQPGGPRSPAVLDAALNTVRDRLAAGVRMRTLYQHSTRFDEATKSYARAVIELGVELRTLDEFFERLVIVDARTAFLPAAADRTTALEITEPALVRFLRDLFERTWERAAAFPFRPNRAKDAAPEIMPEIRQAIRRLLIEGHADKTIGRRLGISERTITAHVAGLREGVGAANRLQLGYRLAQEDLRAD
jgi:DNA-binding NarL/FixJ family response regulator